MLLHEEIDRSFGSGPEHRPIEHRIGAGRRALRHRRAAAALAGLGVVAVLGTTYAVVGLSADLTGGRVATEPPRTQVMPPHAEDQLAAYTPDGELVLATGVEVLSRIENPLNMGSPNKSVGLAVAREDDERWYLLGWTDPGLSVVSVRADASSLTFDEWLASKVERHQSRGLDLSAEPWSESETVRYSADGELQVRPGVVVHEHIENPYGWDPPRESDALDLTFEGQRVWTIVELTSTGFTYSGTQPSNGWATFADYVDDQVGAAGRGGDGWPETLRLTVAGTVVAVEGTEILQRTDDPQLGESFAEPDTPTGAALVRVATDAVDYFVVWRVVDGELDVITTPPNDVTGATFQQLLSYARSQYASGEGLR